MVVTDLVKNEIFDKVDLTVKLSKSFQGEKAFYFSLSCESWLSLLPIIKVDGGLYNVFKGANGYDWAIMLEDVPKKAKFELKNFHYFMGTATDVTEQFSTKSNIVSEKTPFVWFPLSSDVRMKATSDRSKSFRYRYTNLRVFFLASSDYVNMNDPQRLDEVVKHIEPYVNRFIKVLDYNGLFSHLYTYEIMPLTRFANMDKKGYLRNILDETQLSAIELRLSFNSELKCEC